MNQEERCHELDAMVEGLSDFDKSFLMWLILREYKEKIDLPEHIDDIHDYMEMRLKENLLCSCNELIEMLSFELWGGC